MINRICYGKILDDLLRVFEILEKGWFNRERWRKKVLKIRF